MTPDEALSALEGDLPPAVLLLGPGAWEAARTLYAARATPFSTEAAKLTAADARAICGEAAIRPWKNQLRIYAVATDAASDAAQNILLKVIEEPPPYVRFILAGTLPPLETIMSRCPVITLDVPVPGPADDPELSRVRATVASAVRAARDGQMGLMELVLEDWDPVHVRQLALWASEAAAGQFEEFTADFMPGVTDRQALTILAALTAYPYARTAAAVALARAFRH
jgi:hypothetical protein